MTTIVHNWRAAWKRARDLPAAVHASWRQLDRLDQLTVGVGAAAVLSAVALALTLLAPSGW